MRKLEESMRKDIAKAMTSAPDYKQLFSTKDMIGTLLPRYLDQLGDEESKSLVKEFNGFATYFTGFFTNRANLYSSEEKSTAIAFRCINDNLPKFIDNAAVMPKIVEKLSDGLKKLNEDFVGIYGTTAEDLFCIDYFPYSLSQSGIDRYNSVIGGYTCSDGTKVQGLNEYINLHNQTVKREDRIPKLKQLYKQVLSERNTISFVPEKFNSDDEVLLAIKSFYDNGENADGISIKACVGKINSLFCDLSDYDPGGIFVKNAPDLTTVCAGAFGYYGAVRKAWEEEYDAAHDAKNRDSEKYIEARKKAFQSIDSFSLSDIQKYGKSDKSVLEWIKATVSEKCGAVLNGYQNAEALINNPYTESKKLYVNDSAIEKIKDALDAVKDLERTLSLLSGSGKEENKDERFYGELAELSARIGEIDSLYDKVRNYMTQKPYNTDKIKLNFQNPQFLGGWDRNKENDYSSVLLRKDGNYYLAVMPKGGGKPFETIPKAEDGAETYEKMIYKLLPGPNKMLPKVFFSQKGLETYHPPKEILEKYELGTHKTGDNFNLNDCRNLIDYFKSAINAHPDWSQFGFNFSETTSYRNIGDFFNEVKNQGYKVSFCDVPAAYIDSLVSEGRLYLFRFYNKDFSEDSKGTPNLHTLYFKMLFCEENLHNVVIKLNGESEMFYRRASINGDEMTVHPKNLPIRNKNKDNASPESTFDYDIIKDRRYTVDQFMLHVPITLNFTAEGRTNINLEVRKALKHCDDNYVIGIDRGERNLLYVCVINSKGEIVEQFSLNEIVNEYKGNTYKTDYHALLDSREDERKKSRESWKSVESIKELKEGYISQVVHKICQLVEKYDAVIAMEDLNFGFKRVRGGKFEKSVYQKFEKMLIDKLNYCADKKKSPDEIGSVLHAYQLTNKFESFKSMGKQNGFIFYIPAYLTSKIDPTTGFADLLHPCYESVAASRDMIERFDGISYHAAEDHFEFALDYGKFPKCGSDYRKKWTVCTHGSRVSTFRNPEKNNEWDNRTVDLTDEFKKLFSEYGIDYTADLKRQLLAQDAKFYRSFMSLLGLTFQMRNSETGNPDVDYLISPVRNASGKFYNGDDYKNAAYAKLPKDADANGAYNIARKALWAIDQFRSCRDDSELYSVKLAMTNAEWLEFAQSHD